MTTVQDILQRLGKPPVEVCLDWAWQLDKLAQPQPTQTTHSTKPASQADSSAVSAPSRKVVDAGDVAGAPWVVGDDRSDACDWSQLTVDGHGQLHRLTSAAAGPTQPRSHHPNSLHSARLAQLLQWCDVHDTQPASLATLAAPASHQQQTRQLQTHQLHTHLQQRTLQWACTDASPESPSIALADNLTPATKGSFGSSGVAPIRHQSPKHHRLRNRAATLAVAGLLLAGATALMQSPSSTTASSSASLPQAASGSRSEATSQPASATRARHAAQAQTGGTSDESTAHSPTGRHTEQHTAQHTGHPLALSTDSVLAPDPLASSRGSSAEPSSLLQAAATGSLNSPGQPESTDATQELPSLPALQLRRDRVQSEDAMSAQIAVDAGRPADSDVLTELATLSKSAEATTSEVQIASPEPRPTDSAAVKAVPPEPASAPLLLQSFPMIQLQEFDKRLRVRQPQWRLRLVASEGLEVQPSEAQDLSDEQWIGWTIRSAAPSQPLDKRPRAPFTAVDSGTTRVVVQVRLSSKRETSLHWRIVASSEDYPQIAVPLDQAWLDRFQEYLNNYISSLQQESQRMRELGRAGGLSSQARSALAARRRGLDSESKLAAELLQIVADTNQIVGWLDGQIEVHGELVDAAASPSVVLLQFGSP